MDSKTAIEILTDETITLVGGKYRLKAMDIHVAKQIAALIEQQAQEIERLNQTWPNSCDFKDDDGCCLFPGAMTPECHADACSVIKGLKQEIAKKDRMLRRATAELDNAHYCAIGGGMNDNMQHCDNSGGNYSCADCWLAWLEKEAEVHP